MLFRSLSESIKISNKLSLNYNLQANNFKNKIINPNSSNGGSVRSLSIKVRDKNKINYLPASHVKNGVKLNILQLKGNARTKSRLLITGSTKNQ